ncbi:MAG: hypothetical protein ACFCBV_03095 [Phycisphaerales bacterium]
MMRSMLALVVLLGCAAATLAQGDAPTASDRITELEAEVEALRKERDALRVRLAEAIEILRNLGYAAPEPVLAEPSDPMASPLAAMRTLRQRARLELKPLARDTAEARQAYQRAAKAWVQTMNDGLRGERQWLVRAIRVDLPTSGSAAARARAELQLFDAASGAPLSMPMQVGVPSRVGRRMAEAGPNVGWTAHVRIVPSIRHNPDRLERGPFDHPPFLAVEVEGDVGVEWLRFEEAEVPSGFFPPLRDADALVAPSGASVDSGDRSPARQPR